MIQESELTKLCSIATTALETNKNLMVDLRYHQELVCAFADFLCKLSKMPDVPMETLVEISAMSRRLVNFQMVYIEKTKKDWAWTEDAEKTKGEIS